MLEENIEIDHTEIILTLTETDHKEVTMEQETTTDHITTDMLTTDHTHIEDIQISTTMQEEDT